MLSLYLFLYFLFFMVKRCRLSVQIVLFALEDKENEPPYSVLK